MVSASLDAVIQELADQAGMPDAKDIRNKMKRRIQNHRTTINRSLQAMGRREGACPLDIVDTLIVQLFPNTPGANDVKMTEVALRAVENMDESGEDLLVRLYNDLVPCGHNTLKLNDANDPRLVECASDP
jgi:hypothetical protein